MMCDVTSVLLRTSIRLCSLLVIFLLTTVSAFAQIDKKSAADHKQERKKFLKEANAAEAQYKDTHLNVNSYRFKVGEAGRKRAKRDERARFHFNDAGEPVKKKRLFTRKKKKKD